MDLQERIELIQDAINKVEEAQSQVDEALKDMGIRHNYEAYGKYGFNTLLNNGNPYDSGLQDLIDNLVEEMYEGDCEEKINRMIKYYRQKYPEAIFDANDKSNREYLEILLEDNDIEVAPVRMLIADDFTSYLQENKKVEYNL